jgi:hypothetical protein
MQPIKNWWKQTKTLRNAQATTISPSGSFVICFDEKTEREKVVFS